MGDPYRHEWISLYLLHYLLDGCESDQAALARLQNLSEYIQSHPIQNYIFNLTHQSNIGQLPPLAQWLAWLVITHHRLPPLESYYFKPKYRKTIVKSFLKRDQRYTQTQQQYYRRSLISYDGWIKNSLSIKEMEKSVQDSFHQFQHFILDNTLWQKQIKRYAKKISENTYLMQLSEYHHQQNQSIANPFLLYLSRMSLMAGDHHYSSLQGNDARRIQIDSDHSLIANTNRKTGAANQFLDEHLLGVAQFTAKFCRALPALHEQLPKLVDHQPLIRNTDNPKFSWQNQAFKLALSQHENSRIHGFFGVNLASTGGGKTIGNARIMYALADPKKGARITIALGLRVLTLQTGQSFREHLRLPEKDLAILVGGQAQRQLFELSEEEQKNSDDFFSRCGSESVESLLDDFVDGDDDWADWDDLNLGTVIQDENAKKMLFSPMVTCTIDHLTAASECRRGGAYIVPMLRLFSSDLILDEPDDFDHHDLPALSRLVHLAGLFGSRVLLSSATLPPDLVEGLYQAYAAGRKIYNAQFGLPAPQVVCAWFDEQDCKAQSIDSSEQFISSHQKFTEKRAKCLSRQPARRAATVLLLDIPYHSESEDQFYQELANQLLRQARELHEQHHLTAPKQKTVSVGLIRVAHIESLMKIFQAACKNTDSSQYDDCQFYISCYHSRQILLLRNRLETRLDSLLKRDPRQPENLLNHADIQNAMRDYPNKKHHIFIVLATPVAEVGRDHDYDWAIVEPSSMRSIIQLAGRVWRHRPDKVAETPNIAIMQRNIKALKKEEKIVFTHPGFESEDFPLQTHDISDLIEQSVLQKIDAIPRIIKPNALQAAGNLADLEYKAMKDLINCDSHNIVNAYWQDEYTSNRSHVLLSCLTPFRENHDGKQTDYVIYPNEDGDDLAVYSLEAIRQNGFDQAKSETGMIKPQPIDISRHPYIAPWLFSDLDRELTRLHTHYPNDSRETLAIRFCGISLPDRGSHTWLFDERFGCWLRN